MRTTVRIDDDLLRLLKERAESKQLSLTKLLNQVLRQGLGIPAKKRVRYREKVFSMGKPLVNLDKAAALAAADEDDEIIRKMAGRK